MIKSILPKQKSKKYYIYYRWKTSSKALWTKYKAFKTADKRDQYLNELLSTGEEWFEYKLG